MGTLLRFTSSERPARRRDRQGAKGQCEIVIFPGVRIERHALDLGYRVRKSAGRDNFDGLPGKGRPRKSS